MTNAQDIPVLGGKRGVIYRLYTQHHGRRRRIAKSITHGVAELVGSIKVQVGKIGKGPIRMKSQRAVCYIPGKRSRQCREFRVRVVDQETAARGHGQPLIFNGRISITPCKRATVDHQLNLANRGSGHSVNRRVTEAGKPGKAGRRCIIEASIRTQPQCANIHIQHQQCGQGVAFNIPVILQDTGNRGNIRQLVEVNDVRIAV